MLTDHGVNTRPKLDCPIPRALKHFVVNHQGKSCHNISVTRILWASRFGGNPVPVPVPDTASARCTRQGSWAPTVEEAEVGTIPPRP